MSEQTNIETIEWFDDRFYKIVKEDLSIDFYPSVTTVLGIIEKSWLRKYYADLGYEKAVYRSKLAMEKGSRIHEGVNDILTRGYVSSEGYAQEEYFQIWNFTKFYESLAPHVIANETIVIDHKLRSAGTMDILMKIKPGLYDIGYSKPVELKGGYYLIDVKSGNMDYAYHYQTAAYANMAVKNKLCKSIQGTGILLTNADTKRNWKLILRDKIQIKSDYKHFLSALDLYRANGEDKPKVFEMPAELTIKEIFDRNKEVA